MSKCNHQEARRSSTKKGEPTVPKTRDAALSLSREEAEEILNFMGIDYVTSWTTREMKDVVADYITPEQGTPAMRAMRPAYYMDKAELEEFGRRWETRITRSMTPQQMRRKIWSQVLASTTPEEGDYVRFGKHSHLTYRRLHVEQPQYLKWCQKEVTEESCQEMQRVVSWINGLVEDYAAEFDQPKEKPPQEQASQPTESPSPDGGQRKSPGAVSYTHLTLPTILLV